MTALRFIPLAVLALFLGCAPLLHDRVPDSDSSSADTPTSGEMQKAVSSPAPPPGTNDHATVAASTVDAKGKRSSTASRSPKEDLSQEVVKELEALKGNASLQRQNQPEESCPPPAALDFPVVLNEQVEKQIHFFQTEARGVFQRWMSSSTRYKDLMQDILASYDLPQDLIYVAMIESGFNLNAYSPSHAAGPWQFIAETGKRNGLTINQYVDERMDPVKSTRAAAQYLKKLHDEFGCWYLAMAAYNAGEAKVDRGIKRYNTSGFWELCDYGYFRPETRDYVPRILAAALIAREPQKYGFTDIDFQAPIEYDEVSLKGPLSLKDVARVADCSIDDLSQLNPELRLKVVPPRSGGYVIRVPKGASDQLMAQSDRLKPSVRVASGGESRGELVKHTVKRGETLSRIAKNYGLSVKELMALNGLSRKTVKTGSVLTVSENTSPIPIPTASERKKDHTTTVTAKSSVSSGPRRIVHRVRPGDTLSKLSRRYGVAPKDFYKWNEIGRSKSLQPGDELIVYVGRD